MDVPDHRSRRVPWVGIAVALAIIILVIAFGIFKRKGSRKPPPIPADNAISMAAANPYA